MGEDSYYVCDQSKITALDMLDLVDILVSNNSAVVESAKVSLERRYENIDYVKRFFDKHFRECNDCNEDFRDQYDAATLLYNLPQVEPPEHLTEKILKAAREMVEKD